MKRIVLLTTSIMLLTVGNGYCQTHDPVSVKIVLVNFDIETIMDVSCDAFDHIFTDEEKKAASFSDKKEMSHFQSMLGRFKPIKTERSIDVRGSVTFDYDKTSDKYCFNTFGSFYKNGRYYYNKALLIYIVDKIYGSHPEYLDKLR